MQTVRLAFRNLFRNTRRTVLTALLIGFSLGALIIVDAVVIGMSNVMIESVTTTLNGEAQVHRRGFPETYDIDLVLENSPQIERTIAQSEAVSAYAPRVVAGGMVSSSYNVSAGLILGVNAELERDVSKISAALIEGEYLTGDPGEILLGHSLADLLEVELGDRIVLTISEARSGELSQALFRVSGMVEFGITEMDDSAVFINLGKARELAGLTVESHQIILRFHSPDDALDPNLPLYQELNSGNVEAVNWQDANEEIAAVLDMSSYSSLIIASILFVLVSLGLINSMFMSIYERIYEIGVIKAVGTRPSHLLLLVLTEAALIAVMSCIFGVILGGALGLWFKDHGVPLGEIEMSGVSFSDNIYAVMTPDQFIQFPLFVVLLTIIAALYPARFASKIMPAEALQRSL